MTTIHIETILVKDPNTGGDVNLSIYKDIESGGIFGIDTSFLEANDIDEDDPIEVGNPFITDNEILLINEY